MNYAYLTILILKSVNALSWYMSILIISVSYSVVDTIFDEHYERIH